MYRVLLLLAVACGSPSLVPPTNSTPQTGGAAPEPVLVARDFIEAENGARHRVWIEAGNDGHIDTTDACCGVSYDGNRYDDSLATCAATEADDAECGPGRDAVHPGLADDAVCGARRRCVPQPEVRIVVRDQTSVEAFDSDDRPIASVRDVTAPHQAISLGRDGFLNVRVAGRSEQIAVNYGSRYTIEIQRDQIARITRD